MSVDSLVSFVGGKLGELLIQEAVLLYGVEDQVQSFQRELGMMNAFLVDMDAMDEEGGDARSCVTLAEIRKIAYDAEDTIESYILEANSPSDRETEGFIKRYVCFCISIPRTHQFGCEIEAIKGRITAAMDRLKKYHGVTSRADAGARQSRGRRRRQIAYPQTNEEHVVGLEEDINEMVEVLTTDIQVLSIVGMGGSGKTTLARKLYNQESVKKQFDSIAWVSISEEWVVQRILLELLRQTSGETMGKDESPQVLVEKLHRYLEGKRYLIVLDDVWEKRALEDIFPGLPNNGRKVIVTTRKQEVVEFPNIRCFIHEPRRLTEEESWELFSKIAFIHQDQGNGDMDIDVFETLGKMMVEKCKGLPLAVIALAGILSKKESIEEWKRVKKAVGSRIVEEGRGTDSYGPVKEMLVLSYNDLRHELKTCFLYLAMFPEDHVIRTGELIRMWIAEGFIRVDMLQQGETLEDVGRYFLYELIQRCVVQVASKNHEGKIQTIRVHDLIRELCIRKAKELEFLRIFTSESSNSDAGGAELRRAAIYSSDNVTLPLPTQSHHIRSLIYQRTGFVELDLNWKDVCQNFRLLRLLILGQVTASDGVLPIVIGDLIHLRYLGLNMTFINELPSTIGNLRNLLTLDINCYNTTLNMVTILDGLWKIEGLRYLNLPYHGSLKDKVKLHALTKLETLKGIKGGSWMLEELPRLSTTIQNLAIDGIESKEQAEAAFQCPSIIKDTLRSLKLICGYDLGADVMVENLQPIMHCKNLRKLFLEGRIKDISSSCNQFPTSIVKLGLSETGFEEETEVAALGKLPNLRDLRLLVNSYKGSKWNCTAGQFSKLRFLALHQLEFEEWSIEMGAMPQLTKLCIYRCKKVRRVPEGLKFITTLQELRVTGGDEIIERIRGEDAHITQHIPRIEFTAKVKEGRY